MTGRRGANHLATALIAVAIGIGACTGSGAEPSADPTIAEPTPTLPVRHCLNQALFEVVAEELTREEYLDRVTEDDLEVASALFHPDDHPLAGQYVPLEDWGWEQLDAWGVFITRRGQMGDLLPILHERLLEELTPEEFLARLSDRERSAVSDLLYPDDHPQAGQFVPTPEARMTYLEGYLVIRPAGPGCPW